MLQSPELCYTLPIERGRRSRQQKGKRTMSNVTRIDWTVADGNVWADDSGEYDMEASLDHLAEMIEDALCEAYPQATVTVRRENVCGGVRELAVETDDEYGIVDDEIEDEIKAVADDIWAGAGWYVAA